MLCFTEYDFENGMERFTFKPMHSHVYISNQYYKSGNKSLLWRWGYKTKGGPYAKLVINLRRSLYIKGKELEEGGLKLWIYREKVLLRPPSKMEIVFQGNTIHKRTSPTLVNLDFFGWRSLWIGYKEFGDEIKKLGKIVKVKFYIKTLHSDDVYFDLVRFVTSLKQETRDPVLKTVGGKSKSEDSPVGVDEQAEQRSLRRIHALNVPAVDAKNANSKLKGIHRIQNRFDNWYAKLDESLSVKPELDNAMYDSPSQGPPFQVYKDKRWFTLRDDIKRAHALYELIDFNNKRPELFPLNSKYGENHINNSTKGKTKFGFVFDKVLLPLSLDYYLMDRQVEVRELARKYCTKLESIRYKNRLEATMAIAGDSPLLIKSFLKVLHNYQKNNSLGCVTYKNGRFKEPEIVLHQFNDQVRLKRIVRLLDFIEEQGWSKGSGLGWLHKELDQSGSGIMHSIFLLRKGLNQKKYKKRLNKLIKTMKWYTDFNEIFQEEGNYVYDGRTAERMSTLLLYRLMIILINPNTKKQAKELQHFQKWFKSTLKVNQGLGGIIKPDFTSFHHNTFYGSKYVPQAFHNAALVQYLLEGTKFALDDNSKENLRKALGVLRLSAVKYSTPNSIGGAYPGYHRAILADILPAYAYISFVQPPDSPTYGASGRDMLLRLLDGKEPSVNSYLKNGYVPFGTYYMNTIGSIDVLQRVSTFKCTKECSAESSPTGHWSKNFATLSIHRRKDWCVTAKGFNRYNYDFENNKTKNVYGVFASYGALQISNSEAALKAYDVEEGWDWTRVPGATTIKPTMLNRFITESSGYYNPGKFAGGMGFIGSKGTKPRNGIFSIVYKNPKYKVKDYESALKSMQFEFKKSYFFYNDLIVCVGSDIKFKNSDVKHYYAQTTLFQDKLVDPFKSSRIYINGKPNDLRVLMKTKTSFGAVAQLIDTNGNIYQVKTPSAFGLNVRISDQESMTQDGRNFTKGRYATAWFKHKSEKGFADEALRSRKQSNEMKYSNADEREQTNLQLAANEDRSRKGFADEALKSRKQSNEMKYDNVDARKQTNFAANGDESSETNSNNMNDDMADHTMQTNLAENEDSNRDDTSENMNDDKADLKMQTNWAAKTEGNRNDTSRSMNGKGEGPGDNQEENKFADNSNDGHNTQGGNIPLGQDKSRFSDSNSELINVKKDEYDNRGGKLNTNHTMVKQADNNNNNSQRVKLASNETAVKEADANVDDQSRKFSSNETAVKIPDDNDDDNRGTFATNGTTVKQEKDDVNQIGGQFTNNDTKVEQPENPNYDQNKGDMKNVTTNDKGVKHEEDGVNQIEGKFANNDTNVEQPEDSNDDQNKEVMNDKRAKSVNISVIENDISSNNVTINQTEIHDNEEQLNTTNNDANSQGIVQNHEEFINNSTLASPDESENQDQTYDGNIIDEDKHSFSMENNGESDDVQDDNDDANYDESMVGLGDEGFSFGNKGAFGKEFLNGKHQNGDANYDEGMVGLGDEDFVSRNNKQSTLKENTSAERSELRNGIPKNLKMNSKRSIDMSLKANGIKSIHNFLNIYNKVSKIPFVKKLLENSKDKQSNCKNSRGSNCIKGKNRKMNKSLNVNTAKMTHGKCKDNTDARCSNVKTTRRQCKDNADLKCAEETSSENNLSNSKSNPRRGETRIDDSQTKTETLSTGGDSYEYAILVKNGNPLLLAGYNVVVGKGNMHMVEFSVLPDIPPINKVYAYSVFEQGGATMTAGPVISVSAACLMMAEVSTLPSTPATPTQLYLSINNPNIEYERDPGSNKRCTKSYKTDIKDIFSPKNVDELSEKMKFCTKPKKVADITVALDIKIPPDKLVISIVKIMVEGEIAGSTYAMLDSADITKVIFSNLINGLTTEVYIMYFPRPQ